MGKMFCGYYDAFCRECHEVSVCPDGLDGEEDDDWEYDDEGYDNENYEENKVINP
jgi:hypothetical protein